jgi:release factor glutamine methyltransferase
MVTRWVKPIVTYYISKPTHYRYDSLRIVILPSVFHPGFFFSTKLLLNTIKKIDLMNRSFLELGAGSGLISIVAAKNGAQVTASDINEISIKNINENQTKNDLFFPVIHSDLFSKIPEQAFDIIVINPPYYKKDPVSEADHAWYCGENGEYFLKLFSQISRFIHRYTNILMILSDACDIQLVQTIALKNKFKLKLLTQHNFLIEKNFVFEILQEF